VRALRRLQQQEQPGLCRFLALRGISRDNLDEESGNQDENDGSPSPTMIVARAAKRKQFSLPDCRAITMPGAKLSTTIRAFFSSGQRRRP
jgi:hypothetical protein